MVREEITNILDVVPLSALTTQGAGVVDLRVLDLGGW